jgi:hypothetical protein
MWQSMETAPRDGRRVLVDFGRIGVHAVAWTQGSNGSWETWCVDDRKHGPYALRGWIETDVKGWQELPPSSMTADEIAQAERALGLRT